MKILKHSLYLPLLLILFNCASRQTFEVKKDLVRPWSQKLSQSEPFEYPFFVEFQSRNKKLYYLAGTHENTIGSKTFEMIKETFSKKPIDVVLIEGFDHQLGLNPQKMLATANSDGENGFNKWGETTYIIQEALKRNIMFTGGEPSETQILSAVTSQGYSAADLLNFYFVRQIPQLKRDQTPKKVTIQVAFLDFMRRVAPQLGIPKTEIPTLSEFKNWYREKNKRNFSLSNIDSETSAPFETGNLYTQRLSATFGKVRDEYVAEVIAKLLNQYDHIFVVYGGSHFACQQLALEALLGKPILISQDLKK